MAGGLPIGVSIVVPVFRGAANLTELHRRVVTALGAREWELIFVDDGSPDDSWNVIRSISAVDRRVRGISLSRNYGQHSALVAGVRAAHLSTVVTIDDDLQNPPEEIQGLLLAFEGGGYDVLYGVTRQQSQDRWRRVAGRITRHALRASLGVKQAPDVSAFRAFRTDLRDAFAGEVGPAVSLDAMLSWGGARFGSGPAEHHPRAVGESNYTFRKLVRFALDTATGYSAVPLQAASLLGFATACFGALMLCWVLGRLVVNGGSVPGFPFLASTVAIFSGVQLFALGVIGEYVARMHFRVMHKPTYVIRETIELADVSSDEHDTAVA